MSDRIATITPDFKLPEPPESHCGGDCKEPVYPVAYWTGDGWLLHWDCSCGDTGEKELFIFDWPFFEGIANRYDFEAAGFKIEM